MARTPKYRRHAGRDRAFYEYDGKRHYLPGPYKSPESLAAYREFLADAGFGHWEPRENGQPRFVAQLLVDYLNWAQTFYPNGSRSEFANLKATAGHLIRECEQATIAEFTPQKLKELQRRLAALGLSRNYVNSTCARVKRIFRWGVSESLVPVSIYGALATVPGLRRNRSPARETAPRQPVAWELVERILPELAPQVAAMVRIQWLTGARSGSVCQARVRQFDTAAAPWEWRPHHKTESMGHDLIIFIGPQGQRILTPWIQERDPDAYLFAPVHLNGKRAKGMRSFYDSVSYLRAVRRAQDRIRKQQADQGIPLDPLWTPHQLRHARGTLVRAEFGLEAAQAALGHRRIDATQIYAQRQRESARRVAMEMG